MSYPEIIQGGMGIGVSCWQLANVVSRMGQLGVVSGASQSTVFVRRLQEGDMGSHIRRILQQFPVPRLAKKIFEKYYIPGGRADSAAYRPVKMFTLSPDAETVATSVVANFAEVALAKEGHGGLVGINLLEKAQLGNLPAIYGAMLAGVDYVLMGAGIPREIPGVLDRFAVQAEASLKVDVDGAGPGDDFRMRFDPVEVMGRRLAALKRPRFLAIVSSAALARNLVKKASGEVNGFVVEGPTAGGHNAPPRGEMVLNDRGEPVYGERDRVDLAQMCETGLPFWLAGSYGAPGMLGQARELGAAGIQVGTAFAFCRESGLADEIKAEVLEKVRAGSLSLHTDPLASPTGFPFKVVSIDGSVSEAKVYAERRRVCDIGYLRCPFKREDGSLGYRCASEPVGHYVRKGGKAEDTVGRKCLCNGLVANLGLGHDEPTMVTAGDSVAEIGQFVKPGCTNYSAADVVEALLR